MTGVKWVDGSSYQFCTNYLGEQISNGMEYIPRASDLCYQCTCDGGYPIACKSVHCLPPQCHLYQQIEDECCKFICLSPDGPNNGLYNESGEPLIPDHGLVNLDEANLPLRLIASTVTSFLILALLLFMIHRLRQRRTLIMLRRLTAEARQDDSVAYLPDMDNTDIGIEFPPYEEPPPPYTPPKPPYTPGNEAPPPYELTESIHVDQENNSITQPGWLDGETREQISGGNEECVEMTSLQHESITTLDQIESEGPCVQDSCEQPNGDLSVSVNSQTNNDPTTTCIALRLSAQSTMTGNDNTSSSALSNFIKRSDSIEIRRSSSSPRDSFYLSNPETNETEVDSSVASGYGMSQSTHSDSPRTQRSSMFSNMEKSWPPCLRNGVSYPLGWDPGIHSPTDGTGDVAYISLRSPVLSPQWNASKPPTSLILPTTPINSSHIISHNQLDTKDITSLASPRPSTSQYNSPNTTTADTRTSGIVQPSGVVTTPSSNGSRGSIQETPTPTSPRTGVVNRSASVGSHVSLFSVCSETGERRRAGLSLAPDVQYPLSVLPTSTTTDNQLPSQSNVTCDVSPPIIPQVANKCGPTSNITYKDPDEMDRSSQSKPREVTTDKDITDDAPSTSYAATMCDSRELPSMASTHNLVEDNNSNKNPANIAAKPNVMKSTRKGKGQAPTHFKQYGFIDSPEALEACKDNSVYPEAGDKVLNTAMFDRFRSRSFDRQRRNNQDQSSSGYNSKSSGERSRSPSRSRSQERVARRRPRGPGNIDNRRRSEPPNVNININQHQSGKMKVVPYGNNAGPHDPRACVTQPGSSKTSGALGGSVDKEELSNVNYVNNNVSGTEDGLYNGTLQQFDQHDQVLDNLESLNNSTTYKTGSRSSSNCDLNDHRSS